MQLTDKQLQSLQKEARKTPAFIFSKRKPKAKTKAKRGRMS